jgi:DNA-binding beta-propeller fold protein YncE
MTAMRRGTWLGMALCLVAGAAACDHEELERASTGVGALVPAAPAEEASVAPGGCRLPTATRARATSATVAVASAAGRTFAYVADEDAREVRVVDLRDKKEVAHAELGGIPSQLLVPGDGNVYVTLRDKSQLVVLETVGALRPETAGWPTAGLRQVCRMATPSEPVSLATSADGNTLYMVARWARTLTGYAFADGLAERVRIPLERDPYAVATTADGKRAFVSHVVGGRLAVVDLAKGTAREEKVRIARRGGTDQDPKVIDSLANQGFSVAVNADDQALVPVVFVDPGDSRVEVQVTGYGSGTKESPALVAAVGRFGNDDQLAMATQASCLLPRAAAWSSTDRALLVACQGQDEVLVLRDNAFVNRIPVASGPTGVAVDGNRLVVWSQYDQKLSVADGATTTSAPTTIDLDPRGAPDRAVALGRKLFHAAGSERISFDGRACASCHPSGRDDGNTWATVEGPRQTPVLMGRIAHTAPYGWNGEQPDLHGHLRRTLRRLGGTGLTAEERDALFAYVMSLEPPRMHERPADAVARGAELFASAETGCASCHVEGITDGLAHDVGTVAQGDDVKEFDTPSLHFVAQSAPYFHDGRYPTLTAMLEDHGHRMGSTAHLPREDIDALAAYLETL